MLEDNARTPFGVSYMLEDCETMLHMFPKLFSQNRVRNVSNYPADLRRSLQASVPEQCEGTPTVAVLTPGIHNSAHFEHPFLADQMGVELVEGHDLRVVDGCIAMRTTQSYRPVDVIYRRVDDDFLDPLNFTPESMLGVPGIMDIYRSGGITIANAHGTGGRRQGDLFLHVGHRGILHGRRAILKNVETWRCSEPDALSYVLDNLKDLVAKEVHSGLSPAKESDLGIPVWFFCATVLDAYRNIFHGFICRPQTAFTDHL